MGYVRRRVVGSGSGCDCIHQRQQRQNLAEVTGCGHSLHGWEIYRDTRVLNGSVTMNNTTYTNPYPTTLLWRPDQLTTHYDIEPGEAIQEVKFFTNDDVLTTSSPHCPVRHQRCT